jgi:hypothetical protein
MFASIQHQDGSFTVMVDGQTYGVKKDHIKYEEIVTAINSNDGETFLELFTARTNQLTEWCGPDFDGGFSFDGGLITYRGDDINPTISQRIFAMIDQGVNHYPLLRFLERVFNNPSMRAVEELYTFLMNKNLPITDDGYLIAYKYVSFYEGEAIVDKSGYTLTNGDFVDSHTGKSHRNNVGDVVSMSRYKVDDNLNNACGAGLHVGAYEYVKGSRNIVVVKVDPADVVSIPKDSSCQKMRCCKYEVVKILSEQPYRSVAINSDTYDDDYEEEIDYCSGCGDRLDDGWCDCCDD